MEFIKENVVAMIPARMGSERLKMKNLALLDGKPLIYYAIQAAKETSIFSRILINSEDDLFGQIVKDQKQILDTFQNWNDLLLLAQSLNINK